MNKIGMASCQFISVLCQFIYNTVIFIDLLFLTLSGDVYNTMFFINLLFFTLSGEVWNTVFFLSIYYSSFFQETSAIECFLLIYCSSNFQETSAIQCFFINLLFRTLSGDVCNTVFFYQFTVPHTFRRRLQTQCFLLILAESLYRFDQKNRFFFYFFFEG